MSEYKEFLKIKLDEEIINEAKSTEYKKIPTPAWIKSTLTANKITSYVGTKYNKLLERDISKLYVVADTLTFYGDSIQKDITKLNSNGLRMLLCSDDGSFAKDGLKVNAKSSILIFDFEDSF